jgi:hypothetical protein
MVKIVCNLRRTYERPPPKDTTEILKRLLALQKELDDLIAQLRVS